VIRIQTKTKDNNKEKPTIIKTYGARSQDMKIYLIKKQEYKRTAYSDRNSREKPTPEYSVLKPETNSDSDSLKSKGARWVSAKVHNSQTGRKNKNNREDWLE
jgi:hypothetical protein